MSTPDGQAQDGHCKTEDANRQNVFWMARAALTSVSTKEVTDKDVWMEGGQEQFSKPDERSPEI